MYCKARNVCCNVSINVLHEVGSHVARGRDKHVLAYLANISHVEHVVGPLMPARPRRRMVTSPCDPFLKGGGEERGRTCALQRAAAFADESRTATH